MTTHADHLLPRLLDRKMSLYLVATGAGAGVQDILWKVPGCSAFLKGASFPYATEESIAFSGVTPEKFASFNFAFDLAFAAYMRAIDLESPDKEPVGLAVTASVASVREHRGDHQAHAVCITRDKIIGDSIMLEKGAGPEARILDGQIVDTLTISTLFSALGYPEARNSSLDEEARKRFFENPVFHPSGLRSKEELPVSSPLFAGAFNPPHTGHLAIADTLRTTVGEPVFSICSNPPHKDPLSVQEMLRRARLLRGRTVAFTEGDPLYIDKARQHPGTPLIMGTDALLRMIDPKWGTDSKAMFEEFWSLGTKFYVFGREVDGNFITPLEAMGKVREAAGLMPMRLGQMFRAIEGCEVVAS